MDFLLSRPTSYALSTASGLLAADIWNRPEPLPLRLAVTGAGILMVVFHHAYVAAERAATAAETGRPADPPPPEMYYSGTHDTTHHRS